MSRDVLNMTLIECLTATFTQEEREQYNLGQNDSIACYKLVQQKLTQQPDIDITEEDNNGMSALEYAIKNDRMDCAELIYQEAHHRWNKKDHIVVKKLQEKLPVGKDHQKDKVVQESNQENKVDQENLGDEGYKVVKRKKGGKRNRAKRKVDENDKDGEKDKVVPNEKANNEIPVEFNEELFRQAVENDTDAASLYLDKFVIKKIDPYHFKFREMDKIFGVNGGKSNALASILNDSILPAQHEKKLTLLEHPVMKRLLDIKWELFGARQYYRQLLLYILMLMAMTMVVSSIQRVKVLQSKNSTIDDINRAASMKIKYAVWVFTISFCTAGIYHLKYLKPHAFLECTLQAYNKTATKEDIIESSNKYSQQWFNAILKIPEIAEFKDQARYNLLKQTLIWTIALTILWLALIIFVLVPRHPELVVMSHALMSWTVLVGCTLYFSLQEVKELIGEDPIVREKLQQNKQEQKIIKVVRTFLYMAIVVPIFAVFMPQYRKYYASFTNRLQIVTYFMILVPFSILHACQLVGANFLEDMYFYCGACCTISLWMLSLQFLEVQWTSGYLLPIVKDVLGDVKDFFAFYTVFQLGFTCAFYFMFQGQDGYLTLWASFTSTFFVMFGDNQVSNLIASSTQKDNSNILSVPMINVALGLKMFHAAVMVILLLNLFLAMVNKTVDRNWEKLQFRALASYASAVLRLEKMLGYNKSTKSQDNNDSSSTCGISEIQIHDNDHSTANKRCCCAVLFCFCTKNSLSTTKQSKLNPIFDELVSRERVSPKYSLKDDSDNPRVNLQEKLVELEKLNDELQMAMKKLMENLDPPSSTD